MSASASAPPQPYASCPPSTTSVMPTNLTATSRLPAPLRISDMSLSDAEEEQLSFFYTKDDKGELIRRIRTPTATLASITAASTPESSPDSSSGGKTLPASAGASAAPAAAPLTRMRSESAVVMPSASARPFGRVASASAARMTYQDVLAREKENRHPLEYSRSRTPGATLARVPSRTGKRDDDDDGRSTPEEPATTTNTHTYSSSRTAAPTVRRVGGPIRGTAAARSATPTWTSTHAPPAADDVYPASSVMRTPSVTATLSRPRTTGPKRVTLAEKAKQEEEIRRELAEMDRQRQAEEEERRRAREEEDRRRREQRDEEERRRREREEEDRLADEQLAREQEAQLAAREQQQQQQQAYYGGFASYSANGQAYGGTNGYPAQGRDGWYQGEQGPPPPYAHRRRESETAMPPPGAQVHSARHSPSAPKHMRAAPAEPYSSQAQQANYASAPAGNVYVPSGNAPPMPSGSARHKRSPTAPEPRAVQQQQQETAAEEGTTTEDKDKKKQIILAVNKKQYQRLDVLGKGGSSRVYRVLGQGQELLALKRVGLESADDQTVQGYLNEIQLLRRLDGNKRIIRLLDSEVQIIGGKRVLFMIMEAGETDLAKLIAERAGEAFEMDWVMYFWRQMLQAVQVIHDEKIVHSDLKPANFVLVKGCLKLIDFGIANAIANDTTNIQRDHQIGTVNFMSPEALEVVPDGMRRFKVGRPSDVWSLGCILYQMVYGQPPFASLSVYHKMKAIPDPTHRIEFPRESVPLKKDPNNPNTPPKRYEERARPVRQPLVDTMRRCLARNPKERATIPELLADPLLTGADAEQPARPRSPPVPRPETEPRMAYVDDYYMAQVISWVVQKSGGAMADGDVQNTAAALIDELRKMYRVEGQDA
ncbi:kinase-like protein [Auricularia subglabra TFB-10046 SS5]|nr:kinase-like protein [Auricularia subglabra TFB-10046 SS5]